MSRGSDWTVDRAEVRDDETESVHLQLPRRYLSRLQENPAVHGDATAQVYLPGESGGESERVTVSQVY